MLRYEHDIPAISSSHRGYQPLSFSTGIMTTSQSPLTKNKRPLVHGVTPPVRLPVYRLSVEHSETIAGPVPSFEKINRIKELGHTHVYITSILTVY